MGNKENIRNFVRKVLKESFIEEEYPASFNMEQFKALKAFKDRVAYCEQHLQRIAAGSSRIVYKIDNEKVLKLAKNDKGLAQNETEIQWGNDSYFGSILAQTIDSHPNSLWVEMELARKISKSEFRSLTGFDINQINYYLRNFEQEQKGGRGLFDLEPELEARMDEDEFINELKSFMDAADSPAGDLGRLNSYGIVKRHGEERVVLIDYGLTQDVYSTHYDRSRKMASMREGQEAEINLNDNFHKWFAGSKVVDAKGNPMPVHHGTSKKFSKFNFKNAAQQIIWFTSNKSAVESGEVGASGKGHIMDLYAIIKNPAGWDEYQKYGLGQLESLGYDGAILPDSDGTFTGFVFEPSQLKSVKNKGEWNPNDKNIYKEDTQASSNYSLENWPDGKYKGSIKGYDVYSDEIDSGFRATSGFRNISPIPCTIYMKDSKAVVCSKAGIIFSSKEAENDYRKEYGKGMEGMKKYPGMQEYLS